MKNDNGGSELFRRLARQGEVNDRSRSQLQSASEIVRGTPNKKKVKAARPALSMIPQETKDAAELPPLTNAAFSNPQLGLFQGFLYNNAKQQDALSNAVDLWDSVPRYSVTPEAMQKLRVQGVFLLPHEMSFQHRGRTYTRTIHAARVTDEKGQSRDYYPSASEELVEDALRKLAGEQKAGYFDKPDFRSGVVFTLYALREEMKKRGHARSYQQIVQSLNILSGSIIEIKTQDAGGQGFDKSAYLPRLAAVSRGKLKDNPDAKWLVQFHPLVTVGIDQVTYRQYNYALMMSHTAQLTRWLHKQLVLKFTFADYVSRFEMRASTVIRDSGLLNYTRGRNNIDALDSAFLELKERSVITSMKRKDETGLRGKIEDSVFTVTPHPDFIREAKAANKRLSVASEAVRLGAGLLRNR